MIRVETNEFTLPRHPKEHAIAYLVDGNVVYVGFEENDQDVWAYNVFDGIIAKVERLHKQALMVNPLPVRALSGIAEDVKHIDVLRDKVYPSGKIYVNDYDEHITVLNTAGLLSKALAFVPCVKGDKAAYLASILEGTRNLNELVEEIDCKMKRVKGNESWKMKYRPMKGKVSYSVHFIDRDAAPIANLNLINLETWVKYYGNPPVESILRTEPLSKEKMKSELAFDEGVREAIKQSKRRKQS